MTSHKKEGRDAELEIRLVSVSERGEESGRVVNDAASVKESETSAGGWASGYL